MIVIMYLYLFYLTVQVIWNTLILCIKKTIEYFPKILNSENYLEKIPNDKLSMNNVSLIEVAYPSTWIVDFIRKK